MKPQSNDKFSIIGHRGAAGEKFENSLSGFEYALTLNIDAIELDIRHHSGELWVIHDNDLERLTGSKGNFETIDDPSELRLLNGDPIPLLREVLDLCWGNIPLNIEIKSLEIGPLLLELLSQYPAIEKNSDFPWILISSFDHKQILELRHCGCPWELALITTGVPVDAGHVIDLVKPYAWNMNDDYVDTAIIETIQRRGVKVMIFTVNQLQRAIYLRDMGIDGVFTNYPSAFSEIN